MKNKILYIIIFALGIIVLFQSTTCNEVPLNDNSNLFKQIDSLKLTKDSLKAFADTLTIKLEKDKEVKDSVVIRLKTKYVTYYDTISKSVVDCLPKPYVDTLIFTYENIISQTEVIIETKDKTILNLETQSEINDTIIENFQQNEVVLNKEIKKQKKKKWIFGIVGASFGFVAGKLF